MYGDRSSWLNDREPVRATCRRRVTISDSLSQEAPPQSTCMMEASEPSASDPMDAAPMPRSNAHACAPAPALSDVRVRELARIFQLLDDDHDGLLTPPQAVTFATTAGLPADTVFFRALDARVPVEYIEKGYDFDTLLDTATSQLHARALTPRELAMLFRQYEGLSSEPAFIPGSGFQRTAAPGTIPAYSFRHVLAGIPTSHATELTDKEVDAIFKDLGIAERDRVDYVDAVRRLQGGFKV